jgi:sulfatase modifying factor 1
MKKQLLAVMVFLLAAVNFASADLIRGINIDFVTIDHAGNAADTQVMSDGTTGYGTVGYDYRIGKYEVTNAQWNTFTGAAGAPTGNPSDAYNESAYWTSAQQPTNKVSWYETLQFCNYLTSGDKSKGAYLFSGNNSNPGNFSGIDRTTAQAFYGTIYVLPTEDEWHKAAYYKPDGSAYSLYANGLNTKPAADNGWNYAGGSYNAPWNVGTGTQEQNGTFDMMGNVWEWNETGDSSARAYLGGSYLSTEGYYSGGSYYDDLASSRRNFDASSSENLSVGFRVASVGEPTVVPVPGAVLLGAIGLLYSGLRLRRGMT